MTNKYIPDYDQEEEELEQVRQEAEGGADMIEHGLKLLQPWPEVRAEGVEDHSVGAPEKEALGHLPGRQDQRHREPQPLGAAHKSVYAHPQEDVVELDVEHPDPGDDEAPESAVGHAKHHRKLHEQPDHDHDDSVQGVPTGRIVELS